MKIFNYIKRHLLKAKLVVLIFTSLSCCLFIQCKKIVEVDPPSGNIIADNVYTDDEKATASLISIYSQMASAPSGYAPGGTQSFTLMAGLSADELVNYSTSSARGEFYVNTVSSENTTNLALWRTTYNFIYIANAVLEGLKKSSSISPGTVSQLSGEAKFMRAFFYFYLVNLWGDIPYITSTDYQTNQIAVRTKTTTVYQNIISDLLDAQNLLSEAYPTSERVRPNKWTARALLARVYLYTSDWAGAEAVSSQLINASGNYSLVSDLSKVFIKSSPEAIWQLMPVLPSYNSSEGYNFILTAAPSNVSLQQNLVNAFETGDQRVLNWVGNYQNAGKTYYFSNKYKSRLSSSTTEYSVIFRLAEQYLIRAEARTQQNKITGVGSAGQDLNTIRARAGLSPIFPATQFDMLNAIAKERRVELFTEWGSRWLDLKRTGAADSILSTFKAPNWQITDKLYPIPQLEILSDNHLSQNPGY